MIRLSLFRILRSIVCETVCILMGVLFLLPVLWVFLSSLRSNHDLTGSVSAVLTAPLTFANYGKVLSGSLGRAFVNTVLLAGGTTLLALLLGLPAAYGVVRFRRWAWAPLALLAAQILPPVSLIMPLLTIFSIIHLNINGASLIGQTLLALSFTIWIIKPFFDAVPVELEEAARLDGADTLTRLLRVVIPAAASGVVATALLLFVQGWISFLFPLVLSTEGGQPLAVALVTRSTSDAELMAGSIVLILPLLPIIFVPRLISLQSLFRQA